MVERWKKAFTLAELLVVVGIISIMGIVSFQAMSSFSAKANAESLSSRVRSSLSEYDRGVRDGIYASYEAVFDTGSLGFVVTTDFDTKVSSGTLRSFDWSAMSGSFSFVPVSGTGNWTVKASYDSKVTNTLVFSGSVPSVAIPLLKERHDEVSIAPSFNSVVTNRMFFHAYHRENFLSATPLEQKVLLSAIESGAATGPLKIRNVAGRKEFLVGAVSVGQTVLRFTSGGNEISIELRK